MYRKSLALAALFLATVAGNAGAADIPVKAVKAPPPPPPLFLVNDNSMSSSYVFRGVVPGTGVTPKLVENFTHFDVWTYGTNFFTIDYLKATKGAVAGIGPGVPAAGGPAAPCDNPLYGGPRSCPGFTEIYGLFRSTLGWNQIFNTKAFSMGPLTNVEFIYGADVNTDNTTLGSAKRDVVGGLQFDFATPYKGFINVAGMAYKEWQHDGFGAAAPFGFGYNPSGKVDFNTTWAIEALYVQPLGFLPPSIPLTFKSFSFVHGPKGAGEPGVPNRTTEWMSQETLSLDVGQMVINKAGLFSVWASYRWWKNKFGLDPVTTGFCCTFEKTAIVGSTIAF
jgi:hypothetical protein